jgi:hypothetical protein
MRVLTMAVGLLWAMNARSSQLPCEFVADHQIPNCRFTVRSNYALHGPVHTYRVIKQDLSADPRPNHGKPTNAPKLFIQEPGVWLTFSRDGEISQTSNVLSPEGTPQQTTRERRIVEGSKTILISGTSDDPDSFRREEIRGPDGEVSEELAYEHDKLLSHHVAHREGEGTSVEDFVYDGDGRLSSHSIERLDNHGRPVEWMAFNGNQLLLHQRDAYAETQDCDDDDCALISRSWYDAKGSMFREITLQDRVATSWWQRPGCSAICVNQTDGVGLNRPFDRTVSYYFEPDGELLTTVEHHPGRYGNIDNDAVELLDSQGRLLERIEYKYVRDSHGNWIERTALILDIATGKLVDVRMDKRTLTYYENQ